MKFAEKITRMNFFIHWLLKVITMGMFPLMWFAWARGSIDAMVRGRKIPTWGPVAGYLAWVLGMATAVLALHPDISLSLEAENMILVSRLLLISAMVIEVVMSYVALEILQRYYSERLPAGATYNPIVPLFLGSTYVQFKINEFQRQDRMFGATAQPTTSPTA